MVCEICSKLTTKTPERLLFLVFLLLPEKEGSEKLIFELPQPLLIHCMEQARI